MNYLPGEYLLGGLGAGPNERVRVDGRGMVREASRSDNGHLWTDWQPVDPPTPLGDYHEQFKKAHYAAPT